MLTRTSGSPVLCSGLDWVSKDEIGKGHTPCPSLRRAGRIGLPGSACRSLQGPPSNGLRVAVMNDLASGDPGARSPPRGCWKGGLHHREHRGMGIGFGLEQFPWVRDVGGRVPWVGPRGRGPTPGWRTESRQRCCGVGIGRRVPSAGPARSGGVPRTGGSRFVRTAAASAGAAPAGAVTSLREPGREPAW
jgi:hypothetical protein